MSGLKTIEADILQVVQEAPWTFLLVSPKLQTTTARINQMSSKALPLSLKLLLR